MVMSIFPIDRANEVTSKSVAALVVGGVGPGGACVAAFPSPEMSLASLPLGLVLIDTFQNFEKRVTKLMSDSEC